MNDKYVSVRESYRTFIFHHTDKCLRVSAQIPNDPSEATMREFLSSDVLEDAEYAASVSSASAASRPRCIRRSWSASDMKRASGAAQGYGRSSTKSLRSFQPDD